MVSTLLLKGVGDEGDRFPAAAVSGKTHDKAPVIILMFRKALALRNISIARLLQRRHAPLPVSTPAHRQQNDF
jgi:hypothetical protein